MAGVMATSLLAARAGAGTADFAAPVAVDALPNVLTTDNLELTASLSFFLVPATRQKSKSVAALAFGLLAGAGADAAVEEEGAEEDEGLRG